MLIGRPYQHHVDAELGFSLNPLHYVKKAAVATGKGVATAAKATGKGVVKGGKFVAHHATDVALISLMPAAELAKVVGKPLLHVALTPVRHKVDTLKSRRAKKLAWDRRKSTSPTPAENNEARTWAKGHLKGQVPPFGLMLSLLAGTPPSASYYSGDVRLDGGLGDPTTATIIASVPTLLAIIDKILTRTNNSGDAPADPTRGKGKGGGVPGPAASGAGAGGDAAAAGGGAGGDAGGGNDGNADGGGGSDGGSSSASAGGGEKLLGMPKKYVIWGGIGLGAVVVLSLLIPRKD